MRLRRMIVVVAVLGMVACAGSTDGYHANVRRFFHRASVLRLELPPRNLMRSNLDNRNPCSYNTNLSRTLQSDPTYFENRANGMNGSEAFSITVLEVAVFCPGRYGELRAFAKAAGYILPIKRCLLRSCGELD